MGRQHLSTIIIAICFDGNLVVERVLGGEVAVVDLRAVAEHYHRDRFPELPPLRYTRSVPELDRDFCRAVARHFDQAPEFALGAHGAALYQVLQQEDLRQYQAIQHAGVEVRPWRGAGQPYRDSATLIEQVTRTGTLWLYLTRSGHGPGTADERHPMLGDAGVVVDGEPLCHNDILRVVHDLFGHVALGAGFGPRGEFAATHGHRSLYPRAVWPVLFTEQIGQICWFFFGDHLSGPGEPGRLPPARRPYPKQKVFLYPQSFLAWFERSFTPKEADARRAW
ncbi:crotonobetainyl-CoA--carnitine CoA-transferase [Actinokineospora sp. NBRC 105648]|uniref:crotonobetainyl-CoA--carnitine CoA-transferase n=1 Tax=Actinokineospora sp. NBRC 105648 TaxID=3032206 RepID=UPI0024A4D36C|nr:crotonobetainyl-CoA--carnitine CoA-transferase [Actinokineospora sp. NBRC 105648]GLZ42762.1 hypothetical protein Acsp05_63860 [Actinokineospora sp. NBRC 105648]